MPLCPFSTWNAWNCFLFHSFFPFSFRFWVHTSQRGTKADCLCLFSCRFSVVCDSCRLTRDDGCFWNHSFPMCVHSKFTTKCQMARWMRISSAFPWKIDVKPFIETFSKRILHFSVCFNRLYECVSLFYLRCWTTFSPLTCERNWIIKYQLSCYERIVT